MANPLSDLFKKKPQTVPADGEETVVQDSVRGSSGSAYESRAPLDSTVMASSIEDAEEAPASSEDIFAIPVLGTRTAAQHQRILSFALVASFIVLAVAVYWVISQTNRAAAQVGATGQALMQSQRVAKSVSQALVGSPEAFTELKEASSALTTNVQGLKSGNDTVPPLGGEYSESLGTISSLVDRADKNAKVVLGQQKTLTQVGSSLRSVSRQSSDLLEVAETISSLKLQQNASAAEISAAGQLVMLTQRIGKSANEFMTMEGVSPEAVFLLGKDLNSFREIAQGLLNGSQELRLPPARDEQTRERLGALLKMYEETRTLAGGILGNLQGLVSAREAQTAVVADSEPLRKDLEALQTSLSSESGLNWKSFLALLIPAVVAVLAAVGFGYVQLRESRQRQGMAELQRHSAEQQQQESKRVNDANQAAILRLMNELQTVAEGDLTQEATVTEDITGAIADSVNYTVE